ncbi:MAG: hypothetical protein AABX24_03980, partial [Nanoarchaeota archaeon]
MDRHKDLTYWKNRKAEVERAVKILAQKREKTLYLYETEKQSRSRKTAERQLQTLLEYETKELQQVQAGLQSINYKITELSKEDQKNNFVKTLGIVSICLVIF